MPSPTAPTTPTGQLPRRPPRPRKLSWSNLSGKTRALVVLKAVGWVVLVGTVAALVALVVVVRKVEASLPSVVELRSGYRPPQVTRILAVDGSTLAEVFTERRTVVKVENLPPHVKLAVLAAEDANFYEHSGLNYLGIARALWVNLRHGRTKQGASTITQQVVKNLLLEPERTYTRKIREALLSRRIEQELTKDEILELYLNHIYFGSGRHGIEEAARGYFGKHAAELTVAQAALLAGLPAAPHAFSPRTDVEAATRRRAFVLGQLRAKGFITPATLDAAMVESIALAPVVEQREELAPEVVEVVRKAIREAVGDDAARRGGFTVETGIDPNLQRAARAAVREAVYAYDKRWKLTGPFRGSEPDAKEGKPRKKPPPSEQPFTGTPRYGHGDTYLGVVVGHDDRARTVDVDVGNVRGTVHLAERERYNPGGLPAGAWAPTGAKLRVSLDAPLPATTHPGAALPRADVSAGNPPAAGSTAGSTTALPEVRVPLRLELGPQSAFVAIDVRTRHVVALVGSVEGAPGGLDRALYAHRQPGSTFKPFVYGTALNSRQFTAATLIEANQEDFGGYNPKNSEAWTKNEPVRLREALAASINLVAVRVARDVGPQAIIEFARPLGFQSPLKPDLALALGAYEVTPLELATAYSTLASGGMYEQPIIITRIVGPDGREVSLPPRRVGGRAVGEAEAYVLTSMMTSVVDHGTATGAKVLGCPVAGKTGTSNLAKDTWFAGFTPDLVAVTWVGFDDARPLGNGEFGGRTALPAWVSFMKEATKKRPKADFPRPPGVATVRIDPRTGKLPYEGETDAIEEIFLNGTEPTEVAEVPAVEGGALPQEQTPEDPWQAPAP